MARLTEAEQQEIVRYVEVGKPLPDKLLDSFREYKGEI